MDQQLLELLKEEAFSLGLLAIATPTYEDIVKGNKEILITPRFSLNAPWRELSKFPLGFKVGGLCLGRWI